jgi:hypothetical protein
LKLNEINFQHEPEAGRLCGLIKTHHAFKKCAEVLFSPASIYEACKYDMCADANLIHRETYRCQAIAHFAHECANRDMEIDWMGDEELAELRRSCYNSDYGKCHGGSRYRENAPVFNTTCRDLTHVTTDKHHATRYFQHTNPVPGCACPEGQYLENMNGILTIGGHCVPRDQCSCYDPVLGKARQPGASMTRGCATWYVLYYFSFIMYNLTLSFILTICSEIIKCVRKRHVELQQH